MSAGRPVQLEAREWDPASPGVDAERQGPTIDTLQKLRSFFSEERIMICFNGPTNQALIGEIGKALKQHITSTEGEQALAMDVFSVYIEMSQNIRNYALRQRYPEHEATATVVIAALPASHYSVSAVNLVEEVDGHALLQRVQSLSSLDKEALKRLYKQRLCHPDSSPDPLRGAGLGLLEIARRASSPLQAALDPERGGRCFFSLKVTV